MSTDTISTTVDEQRTVEYCRDLYRRARNRKRNLYDNWQRNYKMVHNKYPLGNAGSPTPRDSEIFPVISSMVAWMSDQHTSLTIHPAVDPNSPYNDMWTQTAQDLQVILQSLQINHKETREIKLVLWDAFTFGPGFFKTIWDQSLDGGLGNTKFIRVDPWCLYIDPNSSNIADAEYIIEVRTMTMSEVERRWPKNSYLADASGGMMDAVDDRPKLDESKGNRAPMANAGPLPSGDGRYGAPSSSKPSTPNASEVVVYEFWIKENQSRTEDIEGNPVDFVETKWKCIVIANSQVMLNEWAEDLWDYASHPYDQFLPEDFGELYGVPIVDHLAQPQVYINRLLGALQQNAELTGNPIFLEAANSGLERTPIINRPGQRLKLNSAGGLQNKPGWMEPPPMPPVVMEMVQFWIGRIENISGLGAAIKGGVKGAPSRTSEGVLSTIQEASFVRIRSMLGNLEDCLMSVFKKQADLIIENYNEERIMAIVGPSGKNTALVLEKNHFLVPVKGADPVPLQYSLVVSAGSSMPTSRQARVAEADQAYALGLIDRQAWHEAHEYPNWPVILKRVNDQIAQGVFNPPGARQRSKRSQ